jgi:hypothetical protein
MFPAPDGDPVSIFENGYQLFVISYQLFRKIFFYADKSKIGLSQAAKSEAEK